ncbi:MAG: substrate-binding domain-containing protein [Bryobacteraceae bacterium]
MKIQRAPEIDNQLGKLRRARGESAAQLANTAGVSRQTIYAIEAGNYIPNAIIALRLARALDTSVEDLFRLTGDGGEADTRTEQAMFLSSEGDLQAGQPVQLARVGKKLIASIPSPIPCYLPPADALVSKKAAPLSMARVRLIRSADHFENRVVVAGCDPGISVLARHAQAAGIELVLVHRNSSQSLELLKKGCVHIAGSHLRDGTSGESNLPQIGRMFPSKSVAVISFAWWEEGIVTAPDNPKAIKTVEDLARPDVSIVNREKGAGARLLLDQQLASLKMEALGVRGYQINAQGHLDAAWQVAKGVADGCIAPRAAAQRFGLGFIPLARERYDLAIRNRDLESTATETLFDIVNRAGFRRELAKLGYDTGASGQRML